jgi:hypothetical protein
VRLPVALRDGSGADVSLEELSHAAASIVDRRACVDLPVRTTVEGSTAIVGEHAAVVARSILDQLSADDRSRVIVVDGASADEFEAAGRPLLVVAADRDDVPAFCRAVLEMGSTWRGVWCPDLLERPRDSVGLHVAARRSASIGKVGDGSLRGSGAADWPTHVLSCRRQVAVRR